MTIRLYINGGGGDSFCVAPHNLEFQTSGNQSSNQQQKNLKARVPFAVFFSFSMLNNNNTNIGKSEKKMNIQRNKAKNTQSVVLSIKYYKLHRVKNK